MIGQIYQGNRTCRSSLLKRVLWPSRIGPVKELRGFGPEPQPLGIAYVGVVLLHLAEFAGLLPVATLASERLQTARKVLPLQLGMLTSAYICAWSMRRIKLTTEWVLRSFLKLRL